MDASWKVASVTVAWEVWVKIHLRGAMASSHILPMENNEGNFSIIRVRFKLVLNQTKFPWDRREEVREFEKVPLNTT